MYRDLHSKNNAIAFISPYRIEYYSLSSDTEFNVLTAMINPDSIIPDWQNFPGSVTSGPIMQTPLEIEGSQERLSRLTSAVTAMEESSGIGENFECNICFQKANEAVVTCCGHLFCWPCLYRWLHVHSYHKECPVCKGAIAECSITPIYGRENALASARMQGALGSERIPPRPGAEVPTSEVTPHRGEGIPHEGVETASRLQDDVNQSGREAGDPTEHSQSSYLQRRLAFRREQLRQALANSRYSAAINQNPGTRGTDRQQMLTATALLSQEWEHVINGSRLMMDPTQVTHANLQMQRHQKVQE